MAAFSYQHHPFLVDTIFLPNHALKVSGFFQEPNNINPTAAASQFYEPEPFQEIPVDVSVHKSSCLEQSSKAALSNNEPSVTNKHSTDSSSVVDKHESGEQVTQMLTPMDKKRKNRDGSTLNSAQSKGAGEVKGKRQKKCKDVVEKKGKADNKKDQKEVPQEAPTSYIHVRARRGQATDSHSLAERVRREKISERMKLLQAIVPGCDKVTGKALVLDEIINYVQSLQNQVEFLSMKLASVDPMLYDFGLDLDELMVRPDQRLSSLASPLPNVHRCSPTQPTAYPETTTTFTTANNYPLVDSSASFVLQQGQMPSTLPLGNGQLLWDADDQRQNFINQSSFCNNLCSSFH